MAHFFFSTIDDDPRPDPKFDWRGYHSKRLASSTADRRRLAREALLAEAQKEQMPEDDAEEMPDGGWTNLEDYAEWYWAKQAKKGISEESLSPQERSRQAAKDSLSTGLAWRQLMDMANLWPEPPTFGGGASLGSPLLNVALAKCVRHLSLSSGAGVSVVGRTVLKRLQKANCSNGATAVRYMRDLTILFTDATCPVCGQDISAPWEECGTCGEPVEENAVRQADPPINPDLAKQKEKRKTRTHQMKPQTVEEYLEEKEDDTPDI